MFALKHPDSGDTMIFLPAGAMVEVVETLGGETDPPAAIPVDAARALWEVAVEQGFRRDRGLEVDPAESDCPLCWGEGGGIMAGRPQTCPQCRGTGRC